MTRYSYRVIFRIRHPSIDPREITDTLAMTPHTFWKFGEHRVLPNGSRVKARSRDSLWSYMEKYEGESRNFFKRAERLVNRLKRHKQFLADIAATGGEPEIYIQIPGSTNIGDSLSPKALQLLADLNILLSVEIFPKSRPAVMTDQQ